MQHCTQFMQCLGTEARVSLMIGHAAIVPKDTAGKLKATLSWENHWMINNLSVQVSFVGHLCPRSQISYSL